MTVFITKEVISGECRLQSSVRHAGWYNGEATFERADLALLYEASLLSCMAYVDLSPVRADIAAAPEQANFTSIQLRIKAAIKGEQPKALLASKGNEHQNQTSGIRFSLPDYITLVEATGLIL